MISLIFRYLVMVRWRLRNDKNPFNKLKQLKPEIAQYLMNISTSAEKQQHQTPPRKLNQKLPQITRSPSAKRIIKQGQSSEHVKLLEIPQKPPTVQPQLFWKFQQSPLKKNQGQISKSIDENRAEIRIINNNQGELIEKQALRPSSSSLSLSQRLSTPPRLGQFRQVQKQSVQRFPLAEEDDKLDENNSIFPETCTLEQNLQFKAYSEQNEYNIKKNSKQNQTKAVLSLELKQYNDEQVTQDIGVDIICLLDRSASMSTKLEQVKKGLRVFLRFLGERDRLCLIAFNNSARKLSPFLKCSSQQIKNFDELIQTISADSEKLITSATELAFAQIKCRKQQNNVTSIFLISDGADEGAVKVIREQVSKVEENFSIHTFAVGEDSNTQLMSGLCKLKLGNLYIAQNISLLEIYLVEALGALRSTVAQNIEINMITSGKIIWPLQKLANEKNKFSVYIPQMKAGQRLAFVFQLELPQIQERIQENKRTFLLLKAHTKLMTTNGQKLVQKMVSLSIKIFNEDELVSPQFVWDYFSEQCTRMHAIIKFREAKYYCDQKNYNEAQSILQSMIDKLSKSLTQSPLLKMIKYDLQQAYQGSAEQNYHRFGHQQLTQFINNYNLQIGINSVFDQFGTQIPRPRNMIYNINQLQLKILKQLDASRQDAINQKLA